MFKTLEIKIKSMWPLWPAVLGIVVLVTLVPSNCLAQVSMQQPLTSQRGAQFLADQSSLTPPTTIRQQELAKTQTSKQQHAITSQQRSLAGASNRLNRQQMINYGHLFDDNARSSSRSFEVDTSGLQAPRRRSSKQRRLNSAARSLGLSAGRKSRARAARLSKARALAATKRLNTRSTRQRRDITTTKATLTTGKKQEEAPELNENSFDEYDSVQGTNKKQKLTASDPTGSLNKRPASKSTARFAAPFDFLVNQQQAVSGCNCKCCNNSGQSEQRADVESELPAGQQPESVQLQGSPSSNGLNNALSSTVLKAKKLQDSESGSSDAPNDGPSELKLSGSRERTKPKQLGLETASKVEADEQDQDKQPDQTNSEQRQEAQLDTVDGNPASSDVSLSDSQLPSLKLPSGSEKSPASQRKSNQLDAAKDKLSADEPQLDNKDKKLGVAAKTPSLQESDENNDDVLGVVTEVDSSSQDELGDKSDESPKGTSAALSLAPDNKSLKKNTEEDERQTSGAQDDSKEALAESAAPSKQRNVDERKQAELTDEENANNNPKPNSSPLATQEGPSPEAAEEFARTGDVKQKLSAEKPVVKEIEEKVEKKEEAVVEGVAEKKEKKKEFVEKLLEAKKKLKKHPEPESELEPEPEPEPKVPVYKSKPRPVYKPAKNTVQYSQQPYGSVSGTPAGYDKSGQYSPYESSRVESFPSRCRSNIRELSRIIKELLAIGERLSQKTLAEGSIDYATRDILSRKLGKIRAAGEESLMAANLGKLRILNDVAKVAGIELIRLGHLKTALRFEPSLKKLGAKLRRFYGLYRKSCKGVSY